jgi:osmotically-inducible protein OsmY
MRQQQERDGMRSDREIEEDVRAELEWQPGLDATDVTVSVRNGIVTLAGFVHHYGDKVTAEVATKRIPGVVAVANEIEVRVPTVDERPDPEIARDAVAAIKARLPTSWERIKVIVKNGYVNLEGEVEWQYQRETAEAAVRWLQGVKGVTNFIEIKPRAAPEEIRSRIEEAFRRNAEIDARRIVVETSGSEVILKGQVRSWAEREEAERVAWAAPGVTKVDDRIVVSR